MSEAPTSSRLTCPVSCGTCGQAESRDQWEFDITTGVNLADPRKRVRTYEVDVADGQVYLTA